jgi:hypothetical protein
MTVDPSVEKPARKLIGHVIRQEYDDLQNEMHAIGNDTFMRAMALCVSVAEYITVDVAGRWPTDADVREIAKHVAASARGFELEQDVVAAFLSRVALRAERMSDVFPSPEAGVMLPLQVSSTLLLGFLPEGKHWWEYLDVIENSMDAAEQTDLSLLPALLIRQEREQAAKRR